MTRESVWIIGAGVISAAGDDAVQTLDCFQRAERRPSTTLPFASQLNGPTFQVASALPELPARFNHSRTARLLMKAVSEALAGVVVSGGRVGVCLGTTVASQLNNLGFYQSYRQTKQAPLQPVIDYLNSNLADVVAELLDLSGPRMTVVNACSSGTDAIGIAADWIRCGACDLAIAGGADELNHVALAGFHALGVMSNHPCRPFDKDRSGLNLGEGAGVVVLASGRWIERQGIRPRAEVAGFGAASDAYHLTAPHPEGRGLVAAIQDALDDGRIDPGRVDFINAHGTATQENDRVEGGVIERLFGRTPFVSTKGYTGHTLGAAGGIEAVFTLMTLETGLLPANVGLESASPERSSRPVSEPTPIDAKYGLSLSLAFGGSNAALLLRRPQ